MQVHALKPNSLWWSKVIYIFVRLNKEINISRSIILLRGLPGSGKSTLANILSEDGKYPVLAIDDYFIDPHTGAYAFDYEKNHLAYKQCESLTRECLSKKTGKVFVDNTFTLEWEMEPYFSMAAEFNYIIFVVTVENRHNSINHHGATKEQLLRMAEKYKVILHPF